jgi:hypothetical protein
MCRTAQSLARQTAGRGPEMDRMIVLLDKAGWHGPENIPEACGEKIAIAHQYHLPGMAIVCKEV